MSHLQAQWREVIASRENSTPTRVKARDWINNALRDGRIDKPPHCQGRDCKETDIKAHHYDYRSKDKVKWYCSDCHEKADSKHGASEWVRLTKPVRCRTVADHPQWMGKPGEYEKYNDRPQIRVDTEGIVIAWSKGEMVPNGYNKIPDTYGYGLGPKVKTNDTFLVQFDGHPGLLVMMESQIELLDPIPRRKAAYAPATMHVLWEDPDGDMGEYDYCLDHGFAEMAKMKAQGWPYVDYVLHREGIAPGSLCIVCVDGRNAL